MDIREESAWITLNRPEVGNALHAQMIREMIECLNQVESESGLKSIVITGRGKFFCTGADLGWLKNLVKTAPNRIDQEAEILSNMYYKIKTMPLPSLPESTELL